MKKGRKKKARKERRGTVLIIEISLRKKECIY